MASNNSTRRALLSVSDKTGLVELAQQLVELSYELIATGGTAKLLKQYQLPITDVSDVTGFPEIMDGRVKTLHPKIHGGLLARRGQDEATLETHHIHPIDLLVVNLYPFQQTIDQPDCTFAQAIEQIDIGGPTMLRAAAKNHRDVIVLVDPNDYPNIIEALKSQPDLPLSTRQQLAYKTFAHTAQYDAAIANYFSEQLNETSAELFPAKLNPSFKKQMDLRYGENPHQQAAFYQ